MDRLFLDANILFSAAYLPNAGLLRFWKLRNVILCASQYVVEEAKINLAEDVQRRRLARLVRSVQFFDPTPRQLPGGISLPAPLVISLPEKDWPVWFAAMDAQATHLITGDLRHFGPYFGKTIGGILVVTPARYLKMRQPSR